jgi:hypothetical protein
MLIPFVIERAVRHPARAKTLPTERSIPARTIAIVIPTPIVAIIENWRATMPRFSAVGKDFGRTAERTTNRRTRARKAAVSRLLKRKPMTSLI